MQLTPDQQKAYDDFIGFICDPTQQVFVIEGFAGTGKSTLVQTLINDLPSVMRACKSIDEQYPDYSVVLTATTNKAVDSLQQMTMDEVKTIYSHLGLRVNTDWKTGESTISPSNSKVKPHTEIILIDEASYVDSELLGYCFSLTTNCKIVFLGDPAQLINHKSSTSPVFAAGFPTAKLTQVVRNTGRVLELATLFRETVYTDEFPNFDVDDNEVIWLDQDDFNAAIEAEFSRPDWKMNDSRFLAWTNKRVIQYNHYINTFTSGNPDFVVGDMGVINDYVTQNKHALKTDQTVTISAIEDGEEHGVEGKYFTFQGSFIKWFKPNSQVEWKAALKFARDENRATDVHRMSSWVDLRAAYAQTINKSQGATYDRVFIDIGDITKCNNRNQVARMLYVGTSRARQQVIFTGDFV